jgi:glutamate carboxypeptidase
MGVPVLDGLGIEGDGAHAAHEHILADNIPFRGALLAGLIATL